MRSISHPIEAEELMAYLDGELPLSRSAAAAEHLSRCRECQAVAADLEGVSRRLMAWQVDPKDLVMRADLLAALEGPRKTAQTVPVKTSRSRRWQWAFGFAGAGMLFVVLMTPRYSRGPLGSAASTPAAPNTALPSRPSDTAPDENGPLIVHTAQVTLSTPDFDKARSALEDLLARRGGHIARLTVNSPAGSGRTLQAAVRIPAGQLQSSIAGLRPLGHVESESQGGEEVTQQVIDLEARLSSARATEQRLTEILRQRTGTLSDVLEVEKEMDRVRGEIERMAAERKTLGDRVSLASLNVTILEEYRAGLQVAPRSASLELRNSAVDGWKNLAGSLFGVAQFLLSAGPVILAWAALLFFPGRALWKKVRR